MTSITTMTGPVPGGVDTHGETHHAAVLGQVGRELGDREFPTTASAYLALLGGWPAALNTGSIGAHCSSVRSWMRHGAHGGDQAGDGSRHQIEHTQLLWFGTQVEVCRPRRQRDRDFGRT